MTGVGGVSLLATSIGPLVNHAMTVTVFIYINITHFTGLLIEASGMMYHVVSSTGLSVILR